METNGTPGRSTRLSPARLGPGVGLSEAKMYRDETMGASTLAAGAQCHCAGLLVSLRRRCMHRPSAGPQFAPFARPSGLPHLNHCLGGRHLGCYDLPDFHSRPSFRLRHPSTYGRRDAWHRKNADEHAVHDAVSGWACKGGISMAHHISRRDPIPSAALELRPIIPVSFVGDEGVSDAEPSVKSRSRFNVQIPSRESGPQGGIQLQVQSQNLELHGVFGRAGLWPPECWRHRLPCVPAPTLTRPVGSVLSRLLQ